MSTTRFPMSLRRSSYVALSPPKRDSKTQNGHFPSKIALRLKKVCYKVIFLCENCQRQICTAFTGLNIHAKIIGGDVLFHLKFWVKLTALEQKLKIADFRYIFIRSASAVTSSEKVQLTLIGISLRAFQWAQDERRTLSLSPKGWLENAEVSKIWTISCDNSETICNWMSVTINH